MRHALDRQHRSLHPLVDVDHLLERRRIRVDHIVGEDDGKRFVPDQVLRHEHRVAKSERLALPDVGHLYQLRDLADGFELGLLAALLEKAFELHRHVEVILDRVLSAPRDDDDVVDARLNGLFDAVLDDRLVDEDQHLLRLRLGRREKARAKPRRRKDGLADWSVHACHGNSDKLSGRLPTHHA